MLALEGDLRAIIEQRLRVRRLDSSLIFHRDGKPVGDFRKVWKKACLKTGVQGMILYDLRRTAIRNMVRAGVDPDVVMKISGHKTRSVFSRYNIISDTDIREAVLKTHDYVSTLPKQSKIQSVSS
jgi:integrase